GKNEMKVRLYQSIFDKIEKKAPLKYEAGLHLCLIAALREENGWSVSQNLLNKITDCGIDLNEQGSSSLIIRELQPFWQKESGLKAKKRMNGKVKTVFPHGNAGFIRSENQSFFFLTQDIKGKPEVGQQVSFEWIDSFDKKKNRPSKQAVKIQRES